MSGDVWDKQSVKHPVRQPGIRVQVHRRIRCFTIVQQARIHTFSQTLMDARVSVLGLLVFSCGEGAFITGWGAQTANGTCPLSTAQLKDQVHLNIVTENKRCSAAASAWRRGPPAHTGTITEPWISVFGRGEDRRASCRWKRMSYWRKDETRRRKLRKKSNTHSGERRARVGRAAAFHLLSNCWSMSERYSYLRDSGEGEDWLRLGIWLGCSVGIRSACWEMMQLQTPCEASLMAVEIWKNEAGLNTTERNRRRNWTDLFLSFESIFICHIWTYQSLRTTAFLLKSPGLPQD